MFKFQTINCMQYSEPVAITEWNKYTYRTRVTRKHWRPVHGPPQGRGPRTTVKTGPRTPPPPHGPPIKRMQGGFKMTLSQRLPSCIFNSSTQKSFWKALLAKKRCNVPITEKFLPFLLLSLLVLCPTQCSNSDVHLTVGYLVPKQAFE